MDKLKLVIQFDDDKPVEVEKIYGNFIEIRLYPHEGCLKFVDETTGKIFKMQCLKDE